MESLILQKEQALDKAIEDEHICKFDLVKRIDLELKEEAKQKNKQQNNRNSFY